MHRLTFIVFLLSIASSSLYGQYWQQKVEYKMDIELVDSLHQYHGHQVLSYTNNSPDTIKKVYYHLYFNAFQPGSMMDISAQNTPDSESSLAKIGTLKQDEIGFIEVNSLLQGKESLAYNVQGTILQVELAKPILPGKKTVFTMDFLGQVPLYTRRAGRDNPEGIAYSMAQWYPKMCEYDRSGWNADPYIGREFYGVWGDFDVKITLPSDYILAFTGVIQNPKEVKNGYGGYEGKPEGLNTTWHIKSNNVHDFAWTADKEYIHKVINVNDELTVHLLHRDDTAYAANWDTLASKIPQLFRYVNEHYGKYSYPVFSIVQGGDRGMEYPTGTFLNGNKKYSSLLGTVVHELMHQWYYFALASNETAYPWMDEGFTAYTDRRVMNYIYRNDSVSYPNYEWQKSRILTIAMSDKDELLSTHSDHYSSSLVYGINAYNRGAYYLHQLSYIIGQDKVDKALKQYYLEWAGKHPEPKDFMLVAEKVSGIELDWYNDYYIYSNKKIDYSIKSLIGTSNETTVVLERKEDFIMPIDLEVFLLDGTSHFYTIPLRIMRGHKENPGYENFKALEAWPWVEKEYTVKLPFNVNDILFISIDPQHITLDVDRDNNIILFEYSEEADLIIEK